MANFVQHINREAAILVTSGFIGSVRPCGG